MAARGLAEGTVLADRLGAAASSSVNGGRVRVAVPAPSGAVFSRP